MTFEQFDSLQAALHVNIVSMTSTKGHEYANSDDRLANFKEVAAEIGITPEQVLLVYLKKHMRSVDAYCKNGKVFSEPIKGRIIDAILYLELLAALIEDRQMSDMSVFPENVGEIKRYTKETEAIYEKDPQF